ncbi:hypothetical protein TNIN_146001 [Trichonephila inaurata madagascariensis]|uniref:Uncharacterized protein n=1 Tax=Trichonephila inaurata madagascariensis TaxID=2747483 RepID=A0A8X6XM79_9ARAC|nr:hypothetical protein TNIN_146001 [Trichonephila inaurata madagascariensis]
MAPSTLHHCLSHVLEHPPKVPFGVEIFPAFLRASTLYMSICLPYGPVFDIQLIRHVQKALKTFDLGMQAGYAQLYTLRNCVRSFHSLQVIHRARNTVQLFMRWLKLLAYPSHEEQGVIAEWSSESLKICRVEGHLHAKFVETQSLHQEWSARCHPLRLIEV